jgi:hypothetical protein
VIGWRTPLNDCLRLAAGLVLLCAVSGCAPKLNSLKQGSGPEHTLVKVQGENLLGSQVVWYVGSGTSETVLPGGFLGGYMFTVPPGASRGTHMVALRNPWGTSSKVKFEVTAPTKFLGPRIDHVSLAFTEFDSGQVKPALYVQGANIDVGAVVRIAGLPTTAGGCGSSELAYVDIATAAHRGMWMEQLYGVKPAHLGYPIYHWVSLLAFPGELPAGDQLCVKVVNLDDVAADPVAFTLPTGADDLDMDGDGLLDAWEEGGFVESDGGTVDFDFEALGCHPLRPDILVEVDAMEGLVMEGGVQKAAKAMFAAAPVLNPVGPNGINLYIDASVVGDAKNEITFVQGTDPTIPLSCSDPANCVVFADFKDANFDIDSRGGIFHYAVWAYGFPPSGSINSPSGMSDADLTNTVEEKRCGDDLIVAVAKFGGMNTRTMTEVFVHELGHNLGQTHGGGWDALGEAYKPNYLSVMSYSWQFRPTFSRFDRRMIPTCAPIYWADSAALETKGIAPSNQGTVVDYSHGMGRVLDEKDLVGVDGVCGVPVDWAWANHWPTPKASQPWSPFGSPIAADINYDGDVDDILKDFNNWAAITYAGPHHKGLNTP